MSLILDALRKMEQERKARSKEGTDIRPEVLRYRGVSAKPSTNLNLLPAVAVVVLLVACSAGWLFLKNEKSTPETPQKETSTSKVVISEPVQSIPAPQQPQVTISPTPSQSQPAPAAKHQSMPPTPSKEATAAPVTDVSAESGITISGIAYQDERSMRRAVINGALVGEGGEIAGARVVEIKENRVRFSRGGETFEVVYFSGINH